MAWENSFLLYCTRKRGDLEEPIASNLAKGFTLAEAVQRAKAYISSALEAMLDLGKGSGPINHAFDLQGEYAEMDAK